MSTLKTLETLNFTWSLGDELKLFSYNEESDDFEKVDLNSKIFKKRVDLLGDHVHFEGFFGGPKNYYMQLGS